MYEKKQNSIGKKLILLGVSSLLIATVLFLSQQVQGVKDTIVISTYRVVDGDTIKTESGYIRLIGIDAPESNKTRFWYIECFWPEAKEHLKQLLSGENVRLEFDNSQTKLDKYKRGLAYINTSKGNINWLMIKDGYAREYTYNKAYNYQKVFKEYEKEAKDKETGMRGCK